MILFLNFAPIEFMGGAEKLILQYADLIGEKESVRLIDIAPAISNIYGNLILQRSFKSHIKDHTLKIKNRTSLSLGHFVPFTSKWKEARNYFKNARVVYMRFEMLEIAISLYFGGLSILKKSVAGLFLTPYYSSPRGFVDKLHNIIYGSFLYKFLLNSVSKVHVLNNRDKKLLQGKYRVKNIISLSPAVEFSNIKVQNVSANLGKLEIIYVGELSTRKGVDTIINVIKEAPSYFTFNIVGDGPLKDDILKLQNKQKCIYNGYVSSTKLSQLYSQSDVLLFPSRAESFGMVMAEALGYGAIIVNSPEVALNLPSYAETTVKDRSHESYLNALEKIYFQKQHSKIKRAKIRRFVLETFSASVLNKRFLTEVIE